MALTGILRERGNRLPRSVLLEPTPDGLFFRVGMDAPETIAWRKLSLVETEPFRFALKRRGARRWSITLGASAASELRGWIDHKGPPPQTVADTVAEAAPSPAPAPEPEPVVAPEPDPAPELPKVSISVPGTRDDDPGEDDFFGTQGWLRADREQAQDPDTQPIELGYNSGAWTGDQSGTRGWSQHEREDFSKEMESGRKTVIWGIAAAVFFFIQISSCISDRLEERARGPIVTAPVEVPLERMEVPLPENLAGVGPPLIIPLDFARCDNDAAYDILRQIALLLAPERQTEFDIINSEQIFVTAAGGQRLYVTHGALTSLSAEQLTPMIAHQIAHLDRYDVERYRQYEGEKLIIRFDADQERNAETEAITMMMAAGLPRSYGIEAYGDLEATAPLQHRLHPGPADRVGDWRRLDTSSDAAPRFDDAARAALAAPCSAPR